MPNTKLVTRLLLCVSLIYISGCKCVFNPCPPDEPEPEPEYAYPPEEMLRFFDFPEGSWWYYKCLQDGTVDTLFVFETIVSNLRVDHYGKGVYKVPSIHYSNINVNGKFEIGEYAKEGVPLGEVVKGQESTHKYFELWTASLDNRFNYQQPIVFPIDEIEESDQEALVYYQLLDSMIQGHKYERIYRIMNAWKQSTFSNPIVEEWYVQDVGVIRYTLSDSTEYELINYHINPNKP